MLISISPGTSSRKISFTKQCPSAGAENGKLDALQHTDADLCPQLVPLTLCRMSVGEHCMGLNLKFPSLRSM